MRRDVSLDEAVFAAKTGTLEGPTKHLLLTGIAETGEPRALPFGPELVEKGSDAVRASEHDDADARRHEVDAATLGQRFDRNLVADAFDDDHRAQLGPLGCNIHRPRVMP